MKKTLLTFLLSAPFLLFAQQPVREYKVTNSIPVTIKNSDVTAIDIATPSEQTKGKSSLNLKTKKAKNYSYVNIGQTYYDLQTNSSAGRRVVLHSDGTVSAVWTTSGNETTGFPQRGSGYNYFDNSNWMGLQTNRIEGSSRTGWPSIMTLSDGKEAIIAHESNTGGFIMSTNSIKGNTDWSSSAPILDDVSGANNRVPIWNRSAAGNGYIHVISNYWFSDAAGVPLVTRDGVTSPTTYSRSSDEGATWTVQHALLPGYDSTLYLNGGGDNYAIDVKDSVVAIVIGGLGEPVSLWKSTDNGDNFTYIDVDKFAYKARPSNVLMTDTPDCNDGSLDVIIDASNTVHVFYGGSSVLDTDSTDESFSFFPGTARMMHWKEGDAEPAICGGTIDMDGDNQLSITQETFSSLDASDNVPAGLLSAARNGNTSIVTTPSASIDANGNIFVVYSAAIETSTHFLNANFRDILISYSTDGGATWIGPQNLTQDRSTENTFPCISKVTNDYVHLIFQQDLIPGTHLQNHSPSSGTHPNDINQIQYAAIPVSEILNNSIGQNTLGEEKIEKKAEVFIVSQNQPNPFSGSTDVVVYLQSGSDVTLTVSDILGNVVNEGQLGTFSAGNHVINIDANGLQSGVYFYTISTRDHSITKKMQVQ